MLVLPIKLKTLTPPKDDLYAAITASKLSLKEGDVVAVSSKVVSIHEGQTLPLESVDKRELVQREADWYFIPKKTLYRRIFTIARGVLVGSSGVDESNGAGHYILYPKDPQKSAFKLRTWLMQEYGIKQVGVVITDSTSIPLRRGAIGIALGYAGFEPLKDYRGTQDLFGRTFSIEMANVADGIAAAATLVMGEGDEGTPVAVLRGLKGITFGNYSNKKDQLVVPPEQDLFAPLLWNGKWKKGKK